MAGVGPESGDGRRGGVRLGRARPRRWTPGRIALLVTAAVALPWLPDLDGPPEAAPTRRAGACRGELIANLAFSRDGRSIAAVSAPGRVWLQPAVGGLGPTREFECGSRTRALAVSADGRHLAVVGAYPGVLMYDMDRDGPARHLGIPASEASSLSYSPDGRALAVASLASPEIVVWDIEAAKPRIILRAATSRVHHVAFGPGGRSLVSVIHYCPDAGVVIWDLSTGRCRRCREGGPVYVSAASADGRLLAVVGANMRKVELWDVPAGSPAGPIIETDGPAYAIAVSPDARLLATLTGGRLVSVWDAATGRELRRLEDPSETFPGRTDSLRCLAFSPDGTTLAAAGSDGEIRLWDLGGSNPAP
jgi:WD40 repeat protein